MCKYEHVPQELKSLRNWCSWRYVKNLKKPDENPRKVPFNPLTKEPARTNHPEDFISFEEVVANISDYDGIGILVPEDVAFLDLDDCVKDGVVNDFAKSVIHVMDSPTEISPSGNGVRIFCKASGFVYDTKKFYIINRKIKMEAYSGCSTNRFVTITGKSIHESEFAERGEELQSILEEHMLRPTPLLDKSELKPGRSYLTDDEVVKKGKAAKNGEKFGRLYDGDISGYPSHSEADLGFMQMLAYMCGCDYEQMERVFSKSELGQREKWTDRDWYRNETIVKAIMTCVNVYDPDYGKRSAEEAFADFTEDDAPKLVKCATEVQSEAVPWLIEGVLAHRAVSSIQGLPDSGKSYFTCKLAVEIANGGSFPKADGTMMQLSPGRVLICNFDDSLTFGIKPRLEQLGLTPEGERNVYFLDSEEAAGIGFDDKRLAAVFTKYKPQLAVFDTLQHFIGGKTDLHRANETNEKMVFLKRLAEKNNSSVLIVQHTSKASAGNSKGNNPSILWGLGSVAVNGLFRVVWTVGRVKGEDASLRAAVSTKNNLLSYRPPALTFSLSKEEGFQWQGISDVIYASDLMAGDSGTRGRPPEQRSEAETFLKRILASGKVPSTEIFQKGASEGLSESTLKRAKLRLNIRAFQEGRLWYWEIPITAEEAFSDDLPLGE